MKRGVEILTDSELWQTAADDDVVHIHCRLCPNMTLCGLVGEEHEDVGEDAVATCVVCDNLELANPEFCPAGFVCECL